MLLLYANSLPLKLAHPTYDLFIFLADQFKKALDLIDIHWYGAHVFVKWSQNFHSFFCISECCCCKTKLFLKFILLRYWWWVRRWKIWLSSHSNCLLSCHQLWSLLSLLAESEKLWLMNRLIFCFSFIRFKSWNFVFLCIFGF